MTILGAFLLSTGELEGMSGQYLHQEQGVHPKTNTLQILWLCEWHFLTWIGYAAFNGMMMEMVIWEEYERKWPWPILIYFLRSKQWHCLYSKKVH